MMKHRHRYKIIGMECNKDKKETFEVDIMCSCGKSGCVGVLGKYRNKVTNQMVKKKYFSVPNIVYNMRYN